MNIGIIGTGNMGSAFGKQWSSNGHQVMFGSRNPQKAKELADAAGPNASVGEISQAAEFGEVVVLTIPWDAVPDTLKAAGSLRGKTLIDCTNPVDWGSKDMRLVIGGTTSAAEEIASMASGANVVKSFNTIYSPVLDSSPEFGSLNASVFYCGDDASAKEKTARLAKDIGFDPVDIGPLYMARHLEPLGAIMIKLLGMGVSPESGYALLRR